MVIWSGLGIVVGLAGFLGFALAEMATRFLTHDNAYYASHPLSKLGGAVLAGLLSFVVMKMLESRNRGRVLLDPATGQEVVLRRKDSLFFIPAKYLPYVIFVIGIIVAFVPEN